MSWKPWTSCTVTCNGGTQTKTRSCNPPDGNCEGSFAESRRCNRQSCPPRIGNKYCQNIATLFQISIIFFSKIIIKYYTICNTFSCSLASDNYAIDLIMLELS